MAPLFRDTEAPWDQAISKPPTCDIPALRRALGNNLKHIRESAGLTQTELERRSGLERSTISKLERGEQEARISTLAVFAIAMRVPLIAFIEELDDILANAEST
jgi:transcriptional regulator with XRE-family HTH domain